MGNRHKSRKFGPWRSPNIDHDTWLRQILLREHIMPSEAEFAAFRQWFVKEQWQKFQDYYMQQERIAIKAMDSTPIVIPNGTLGKEYVSPNIVLPDNVTRDYEFEGLKEIGLLAVRVEGDNIFSIQGTPTKIGDFKIKLKYTFQDWIPGKPILERELGIVINPDPRSLWRNIPTSPDVPYYKPDTQAEYVKIGCDADGRPCKDIVAASQRGRSHAQDGKPRDDHFKLFHCPDSGWYIIAVADGAGSASYSRKGSEVACNTVVDYCKDKLLHNKAFDSAIRAYQMSKTDDNNEAKQRKVVGDMVYDIVGKAAFAAHKAINKVSAAFEKSKPKDFATTLMFAICKKFDFGWFFGSFWVGDGAMCLYDETTQTFTLLGTPDEGEFSGQTRFLTMDEIFKDTTSFYKRLRFGIKDDFTALMLMTDGVSDPMFGTDANLNNINKWNEFWHKLQAGFPEDGIAGVDMSDDNEASKDQLLQWLSFWMPGEHDDRTIAILH